MPLTQQGIYYADFATPMAAEAISAARATSVGNKIEELLAQSNRAVASDYARDELYPEPKNGDVVWRTDLGIEQRYYEEYSAQKNPGGRTPAGWYATTNTFVQTYVTGTGYENGITLSNVFNNTFDYYLVLGDITTSAGANLYGRMAQGGVYTTTNNYQRTRYSSEGSAVTSSTNTNDNVFFVSASVVGTGTRHSFKMTFANPMKKLNTRIISDYSATTIASTICTGKATCTVQDALQYDGFYFYATGGALMDGGITIYGYN